MTRSGRREGREERVERIRGGGKEGEKNKEEGRKGVK